MKKILFICSLYYPHVGGIETFVSELSEQLKSQNITPVILTKKWPEDLKDFEIINGIEVFRVNSFKNRNELNNVLERVKIIELSIKSDIIHIVGMRRSLPILALYLSKKWSVPLVVSYGGGEISTVYDFDLESNKTWNESKEIAKIVTDNCDWNVTFSYDLVQKIKFHFPEQEKIDVIHAGIKYNKIINQDPIHYHKNRKVLFSLRRLVWSKGVDLSIECFNRLKNDFPDFDLIIAGEGDQKEKLIKRVKELSLDERVKFIGNLSLNEAYSWLKISYVTLVPSRSEGGGIVNIEAGACGCPVVASRATGIAEYTREDETSLLFNINDIDDFENQLRVILSNKELRNKMSKHGMDFAKKFDWKLILNEYLEGYKRIKINYLPKNIKISKDSEYFDLFS